jgi:hypothetical protein
MMLGILNMSESQSIFHINSNANEPNKSTCAQNVQLNIFGSQVKFLVEYKLYIFLKPDKFGTLLEKFGNDAMHRVAARGH